MISFILISPENGQYTIDIPDDEASFLVIKDLAYKYFNELEYNNPDRTKLPLLSTSGDKTIQEAHIDEMQPLEAYHLQAGGVIFYHTFSIEEIMQEN